MKYKVGDRVRIKSIDWYNENKGPFGEICPDFIVFLPSRSKYCGQIMTVKEVLRNLYNSDLIYYKMIEDSQSNDWTDGMIEGLAEEPIILNGKEVILKLADVELPSGSATIWDLPNGYIFKDENGNVINATKIVLKKKKEYPKTYEECCRVLGIDVRDLDILDNMLDTSEIIYRKNLDRLLNSFRKLLICRDAYCKIAGEEMRLGEPWKPYWEGEGWYVIVNHRGDIVADIQWYANAILSFPTKEMRDAFKENFDPDIEICKELL